MFFISGIPCDISRHSSNIIPQDVLGHPSLGLVTPASSQAPFPSSGTPPSGQALDDLVKTPKATQTLTQDVLRTPLSRSTLHNSPFFSSPHPNSLSHHPSSYSLSYPSVWREDLDDISPIIHSTPTHRRQRSDSSSPTPSTPSNRRHFNDGPPLFQAAVDQDSGDWIVADVSSVAEASSSSSRGRARGRGRGKGGRARGGGGGGGRGGGRGGAIGMWPECPRGGVEAGVVQVAQSTNIGASAQRQPRIRQTFGETLEQTFTHLGTDPSDLFATPTNAHTQFSVYTQLHSVPVIQDIQLGRGASDLLLSIGVTCRQILDGKINLSAAVPMLDPQEECAQTFSLESLARKVVASEKRAAANDLAYMIDVIQFRCEVAK